MDEIKKKNDALMISVVVPFYNREDTIGDCLKAIFDSDYSNFEVVAVDDNSSDTSFNVAKAYPVKVIAQKENAGSGRSRNAGVKASRGEVIVFIDSDVLIERDALSRVAEDFGRLPEISAVQAIYSAACQYGNFTSIYSNLHYHFYGIQIKKEYVSSVATYFLAVKKDVFDKIGGFDEDVSTARFVGEDQLIGYKFSSNGYRIYLDKRIAVEHKKRYSFWGYLMHDVQTGNDQVLRFLGGNTRHLVGHFLAGNVGVIIPAKFVYSLLLAFLILLTASLCLFVSPYWLRIFLLMQIALFYSLNGGFLSFVFKRRKAVFCLKSAAMTYLKMLFAAFGCLKGGINFIRLGNHPHL